MQPIQPIAERFPALAEQEVELTYYAPGATAVHVAGSFNGWSPESNLLERTESGEWLTRMMLRSGHYEYCFVVDCAWTNDPQALQSAVNPYGGLNSVLTVGLDDRTDLL